MRTLNKVCWYMFLTYMTFIVVAILYVSYKDLGRQQFDGSYRYDGRYDPGLLHPDL